MPSLGLHLIFKGMGNISKNIHFPMILQDCSAQQSETRRSRPHWQRLVRPRPHPHPPSSFLPTETCHLWMTCPRDSRIRPHMWGVKGGLEPRGCLPLSPPVLPSTGTSDTF